MESREASSGTDNCIDSRLWYACAGSMVQMPSVNSSVFYFPQGHCEHALGSVDFRNSPRIPARIPCRVSGIKFMADRVTDEVFAKIRLVPVSGSEMGLDDEKSLRTSASESGDKHTSFAKTLTQSDANNGGGFSVPRFCAETIFPSLDYNNDPPVQTIVAKDVHGETWKFRHIYRGTPRRHLLTTGWSIFVNHKSLVAGDSVVFMRGENSDVYLGIRRAKKGTGGGLETPTWWNSASGNSGTTLCLDFSPFSGEGETELGRHGYTTENRINRGRVKAEDVVQAATLAANGQPFDVIYYPRANTPEFCVKASQVIAALRIQWSPGMRFKMPFETEDSSRISWFMGTISSVQVADPIQWPDSPWRLLQVTWDEPDLLQNVKRVSPWLVELVPDIPSGLLSFSSPRKRLRSPHQDFPLGGKVLLPSFSSHPVLPPNNIFGCLPITTPGSIQGARHAQYGFATPYFHSSEQPSVCFRPLISFPLPCQGSNPVIPIPERDENVSCLLSIGNSAQESIKSDNSKAAPAPAPFVLFGKPILTDHQISQLCSNDSAAVSQTRLSNTCNVSGSCFDLIQNKEPPPSASPSSSPLPGLDGLCKVFLESEDVGRTLDLSSVDCYADVRLRLKDLFGIQVPETPNLIIYRDAAGTVRQLGDEPFW